MPSLAPVMEAYSSLYPAPANWTKPFKRLAAVAAVRSGADPKAAAKQWNTTRPLLEKLAGAPDPVKELFGHSWDELATHDKNKYARQGIAQMLLGTVAEQVFESLFRAEMTGTPFVLDDVTKARDDTDYHVRDGSGHAVFRVNVKAHGTRFRNAQELVSLDPDDCFALATYKIYQGLQKEKTESLPYVFMVASASNLTSESVGSKVPDGFARLATLMRVAKGVANLGKRTLEEDIVARLLGEDPPGDFAAVRDEVVHQFESAQWRAISAKKADELLRRLLFDRVYAVKVRGFAQNYRNAELDMHFSLSRDMTPFHAFVETYRAGGTQLLSNKLARGEI